MRATGGGTLCVRMPESPRLIKGCRPLGSVRPLPGPSRRAVSHSAERKLLSTSRRNGGIIGVPSYEPPGPFLAEIIPAGATPARASRLAGLFNRLVQTERPDPVSHRAGVVSPAPQIAEAAARQLRGWPDTERKGVTADGHDSG